MVDYKKSNPRNNASAGVLISARGSRGRINVFFPPLLPLPVSELAVAPQSRAFSICNADKMEIPGRICKSSGDVIGFVAANDESDPGPSDGRVIFRVFVSSASIFLAYFFFLFFLFACTPKNTRPKEDVEREERPLRRGLDCFNAEPCN